MLLDSNLKIKVHMSSHVRKDVAGHTSEVPNVDRVRLLHQEPATVWLTGLSGAGKSTIAFELERQLMADGCLVFVLDGDNVRHGLSRDLGFSPQDRRENIRRIAEVAKLFNDAGLLVIASFISPYREDRMAAREIIGQARFIETHLCTDIHVCEDRDPKGLYKRAREGIISEFTGITAPYEAPDNPELSLDTGRLTVEESVSKILQKLAPRLYIVNPI